MLLFNKVVYKANKVTLFNIVNSRDVLVHESESVTLRVITGGSSQHIKTELGH